MKARELIELLMRHDLDKRVGFEIRPHVGGEEQEPQFVEIDGLAMQNSDRIHLVITPPVTVKLSIA